MSKFILPHAITIAGAEYNIQARSVNVDPSDSEQEDHEVQDSLVGECHNEEGRDIVWYIGPLREFEEKRRPADESTLQHSVQSGALPLFLRSGARTFRCFSCPSSHPAGETLPPADRPAKEADIDSTPSRRAREKYTSAVASEVLDRQLAI